MKHIVVNALIAFVMLFSVVVGPASAAPELASQSAPTADAFDCGTVSGIPLSECQALVDFFNSTGGWSWNSTYLWLQTDDPCSWVGVICEAGHVTGLEFIENGLSGSLPASIANLTMLQSLVLVVSSIGGPIPPELGSLENLTALVLVETNFTGSIPVEIGNLTNLTVLNLEGNPLSGALPAEIGNLVHLFALYLEGTQITGEIPASILNLTNLTYMSIPCGLTSTDPAVMAYMEGILGPDWDFPCSTSFTSCADVYQISTAECNVLVELYNTTLGSQNWVNDTNWLQTSTPCDWFGVTCENEMGPKTVVTGLNFNSNGLSGVIPASLGTLTGLGKLELTFNQLHGVIPVELGNLVNLYYLSLGCNYLTGTIPVELMQLTNLLHLDLKQNYLTGPIPAEIGNLTNLRELLLNTNILTGPIPAEIGNLIDLRIASLGINEFTGTIPDEIGNLTQIDWLYLSHTKITGEVPSSIINLTNMSDLTLPCGVTSTNPDVIAFLQQYDYGWQYTCAYDFSGFRQPVDNLPVANQVKAGASIPIKFSLGGDKGLDIFMVGGDPSVIVMGCDGSTPIDAVEWTTTANSGLSYDPATDEYTYVWKTKKSWAGQCAQLWMQFNDANIERLYFRFK